MYDWSGHCTWGPFNKHPATASLGFPHQDKCRAHTWASKGDLDSANHPSLPRPGNARDGFQGGFDPPFGIIEATKRKDIACHCIQTILIKHGNWHKNLGLNWLNQPTKIWGQSQQPMSWQQLFQALRSGAIGLTSPSFASQLPTESSTSDNPSKWEMSDPQVCLLVNKNPMTIVICVS